VRSADLLLWILLLFVKCINVDLFWYHHILLLLLLLLLLRFGCCCS
jgi:hypothetical protein